MTIFLFTPKRGWKVFKMANRITIDDVCYYINRYNNRAETLGLASVDLDVNGLGYQLVIRVANGDGSSHIGDIVSFRGTKREVYHCLFAMCNAIENVR